MRLFVAPVGHQAHWNSRLVSLERWNLPGTALLVQYWEEIAMQVRFAVLISGVCEAYLHPDFFEVRYRSGGKFKF